MDAFLLAVVLTRGATGAWELLLLLLLVEVVGAAIKATGADDDAHVFFGAVFAYDTSTRKQ